MRGFDSTRAARPESDSALQDHADLLDRLLNDPDMPLQPHKIWALAEQVAKADSGERPASGSSQKAT